MLKQPRMSLTPSCTGGPSPPQSTMAGSLRAEPAHGLMIVAPTPPDSETNDAMRLPRIRIDSPTVPPTVMPWADGVMVLRMEFRNPLKAGNAFNCRIRFANVRMWSSMLAFDGLPPAVKTAVYERMIATLTGNAAGSQARLSAEDRRAILEILKDTKPDFPGHN